VTQAVAQQLQDAGINASINSVAFSTIAGDLLKPNPTYCIGYQDWGGSPATATGDLVPRYTTGNFWNIPHISDATLDGMLTQFAAANPSQIHTLSSQIQSYILQKAYDAILFYPSVIHGVSTSATTGYQVHPSFWWGIMIFDPVIGANVQLTHSAQASMLPSTATMLSAPGVRKLE
jgi:ABC-type transport system substrate-binding protein